MNVRVRDARPDDAEAIAALNSAAWKIGFRDIMPTEYLNALDGWPEQLRARLLDPIVDSVDYVAVGDDDVTIGWLAALPAEDEDTNPAEVFEVRACYTHPDHWRCGVARTLMSHLLKSLANSKWQAVILWTPKGVDRSRQFYEAMGFVLDGGHKDVEYGTRVTLVRYRRTLRSPGPQPLR